MVIKVVPVVVETDLKFSFNRNIFRNIYGIIIIHAFYVYSFNILDDIKASHHVTLIIIR